VPLAELGNYTDDASVLRMADKWRRRAIPEALHDSRRR